MKPMEEALARTCGARFWKCALQVNTGAYLEKWRGQNAGADKDPFNRDVAQACGDHGIEVVGLADHDDFELYEALTDALMQRGVVVFPGFELTSSEGFHMVCLYPPGTPSRRLREFRGALGVNPDRPSDPARENSEEIARNVLERQGGIWYAPHMTQDNGILKLKRHDAWRESRWVLAGHIPGPIDDLPQEYRQIVMNKNPDYRREWPIAPLHAADVSSPEDLAKASASCYVKMTEPSIEGLIQAFLDPESRIRLAAPEEPHAVIEAVAIANGYFDGLRLHFSDNLNAVIGGRGTGKSTLLECLRYALELSPIGGDAQKTHQGLVRHALDNGGSLHVQVRSAAQLGRRYTISRRFGEPAEVRDEDGGLSRLQPRDLLPGAEIYGQNEILEIARNRDLALDLVRRLLPGAVADQNNRNTLTARLAGNRSRLCAAREEVDALESRLNQLPGLEERSRDFQSLHLDDIRAIERERQVLERAGEDTGGFRTALSTFEESFPTDLAYLSEAAVGELPHAALWHRLREKVQRFGTRAQPHLAALAALANELEQGIGAIHSEWNTGRHALEEKLARSVAALPGMAGKSGPQIGREYTEIVRQIETLRPLAAARQAKGNLVASLEEERRKLLSEWRGMQHADFDDLHAAATRLNEQALGGKLRIEIREWGNREPLKAFLKTLDGIGEAKTRWVDTAAPLSVASLVDAIRKGVDALLDLFQLDGLTQGVAERLAAIAPDKLMELEELELPPRVNLLLNVSHQGKEFRDVDALSTGQKCTAILHLLLLERRDPLIVDQPEDHLDNAFIAERIVAELREAKQRRQFLFATHNANIPVFGDAEWIAPLFEREQQGRVDENAVGSIDLDPVKARVREILEGGKQAFEMRRAKYGY